MGVRLPSAYQEVEWIGTSGTQIIDTDYLPIDGDEMSFDFEFSAFPPYRSYACLMATDNSDPQYQMVFGIESNERTLFYKYFSSGAARNAHIPFIVGTRYRADIVANGTLSIGDYTVTPVNNLGYATGHLRFFARMAGNINFYGRLYKFVASHGGIEKVNLVPCYRKADDEAGLYDLISGTFFVNQGTGDFLVGPDVIDSISPWLVARRRMLMRQYIGYEENKGFTGSYSNVSTGTLVGRFLTGFIPIKGAKRLSCYYGGNITSGTKHFMVEYNGDKIYTDQKGYWDMTVKNQRTVTLYTSDVQYVRFSGFMDEIDQCYVKNADTGEILWKKGM